MTLLLGVAAKIVSGAVLIKIDRTNHDSDPAWPMGECALCLFVRVYKTGAKRRTYLSYSSAVRFNIH